jgi:hypothetical protein
VAVLPGGMIILFQSNVQVTKTDFYIALKVLKCAKRSNRGLTI